MENFQLNDLKEMDIMQLEALATEIRKQIIGSVSKNGGHLSSNLGMVELTIALHKVFDSPYDHLIFDVSHQTYTHKILTDRYLKFASLRQMNGIDGFTKRSESIHDVYEAGHSSTSISAGLGFLEAKKSGAKIGEVISIIGDASITNGLAFEALNYLGAHPEEKMIIILNDNEMSISKNVGALAKQFNKIRARGKFKLLRKITPKAIKKMLKSFAYNQNIFESLGIRYFEGINGHDFNDLLKYLKYAKDAKNSVLLHVKTIKGKGYRFAEEDASGYWHHVEPFDVVTGLPKNNQPMVNFGQVAGSYLGSLISEGNKNIRIITPAMALGSGLVEFANNHPEQFIDVGIAEESAVVMASSMAQSGLRPFVFIYSTFLQRAYDEIIHDVGRTGNPVCLMIDRAGIISGDGDTHQGIYDVAFLHTIPGIEILAPMNTEELKYAIDYALRVNHPLAIRYAKNSLNENLKGNNDFSKWDILKEGSKYIITYGNLLNDVYNLYHDNQDVGIVNAKNLSLIDHSFMKNAITKQASLFIYEEVIANNNLGSLVINQYHNQIPITSISLPNTYIGTGSKDELLKKYLPDLKTYI